jgi:hypothetical protein
MRSLTKAILSTAVLMQAGVVAASDVSKAAAIPVRIEGSIVEGFSLLRGGKPFQIRGAGGHEHLDVLAACGGNTIRTWDVETLLKKTDGVRLIDRAAERGIAVTVGIWLGHERHGFDYGNPRQLQQQRDRVVEAVKALRDHPAVLTWGLGNEMEGPTGSGDRQQIWQEIDRLAGFIKSLDTAHPVMTVVANINPAKVAAIKQHAPQVDILGVNAYSGATGIGGQLRQLGWEKPYCITEYGLPGPWEVEKTAWNAPREPTSRKKAGSYNVATREILADKACLGAYVFLWGQKQEATASWFGMFLPSGEKTITVDAVTDAWTDHWPADRSPVLREVEMPLDGRLLEPGAKLQVTARYRDPEGEPLSYEWEVRRESSDHQVGGDVEQRPAVVPDCIVMADAAGEATVRLPRKPGAYRLFVTVRDGHGSGCMDNWPFAVTTTDEQGSTR